MDQVALDEFLQCYYRRPRPGQAPEALRSFSVSLDPENRASVAIGRYFFRRIAQDHPEIIAGYEALLDGPLPPSGQAFVQEVLVAVRTNPPGTGNALDRSIATPADNDLHWVEFCLTGQLEPVRRLVEVLEWPDRVRRQLERWLSSRPPFALTGALQRRRRLRQLAGGR